VPLYVMVSVEVSIDTRHEDIIHDAQMDFYGRFLASCSSDSSVKIFEISHDSQTLIADLREHQGPVWQISWSHPQFGNLLASCGYDKKVIIYGTVNGVWQKFKECCYHDSSVNSVCWAPPEYGPTLACGSSDGSISVFTILGDGSADHKKISDAHNIGINAVCWAPLDFIDDATEGEKIVKRLVSGGCDGEVKIWRESNSRWVEETVFKGHNDWVRDVAWCPMTTSNQKIIASCDQAGCVNIWTQSTEFGNNQWQQSCLPMFPQVVWHLSWSVTGDVLAVSCGDNNISLWKQNLEGQWACISAVNQGEGDITNTEE